MKVIHIFNKLCVEEYIYHYKMKPRIPKHNAEVGRSHRNYNERSYNTLNFTHLNISRYEAKLYLKRSNNISMAVLNYRAPNEQRTYLEQKINSNFLN